jgi:hypothetical protein
MSTATKTRRAIGAHAKTYEWLLLRRGELP